MSIDEMMDEEVETNSDPVSNTHWARRFALIWIPIMALGLYLVAVPIDGVINGRDILGGLIVLAGISGVFVDMAMVNRGKWK